MGATLCVISGKMAAGKTTLARRMAQAQGLLLFSEDDWLAGLYPGAIDSFQDYLRLSRRWRGMLYPLLVGILRGGRSVVLDFAGNTVTERAWVRSICAEAGAAPVLYWIEAPDDLCRARLARREAAAPPGCTVIGVAAFDAITRHFEPPAAAEGFPLHILYGDHSPAGIMPEPAPPFRVTGVTCLVPDYGEALRFFVLGAGFTLVEDTPLPHKDDRWVVVRAPGGGTELRLARSPGHGGRTGPGDQGGGRVFLFIGTCALDRDLSRLLSAGAVLLEPTRVEPYGRVAVIRDPWGNRWDVIEKG